MSAIPANAGMAGTEMTMAAMTKTTKRHGLSFAT